MTEYIISWNERIFFESVFITDAEQGSPDWWDAFYDNREWLDSNGMDDLNVEVVE